MSAPRPAQLARCSGRCRRSRRGCGRSAWAARWCRRRAGTPRRHRAAGESRLRPAARSPAAHSARRSTLPGRHPVAVDAHVAATSTCQGPPAASASSCASAWWSKSPQDARDRDRRPPRRARPGRLSSACRCAGSAITGTTPARRHARVRTTNSGGVGELDDDPVTAARMPERRQPGRGGSRPVVELGVGQPQALRRPGRARRAAAAAPPRAGHRRARPEPVPLGDVARGDLGGPGTRCARRSGWPSRRPPAEQPARCGRRRRGRPARPR